MLKKPFIKGKKVIEHIEKHGFEAYFVGGCVRDLLIERTIGDIDIATSAKPQDLQRIFQTVIPVGIEHGTVILRWERVSFEVTTYRLEDTYSDQRHPDSVQFVQTIDQDLKRRDFTMNAIAMDKHGGLIDPYEGQSDIKHKQIRAVGNGYDRFLEDPLRVMRAIRFSSQLGFAIEIQTLEDMVQAKSHIHNLAVERLAVEVTKLFAGNFVNTGMIHFKETGIINELPVFKENPEIVDELPHKMIPLQSFGEIIAMLHGIYTTVPISEWIHQWKASNKTKQEAETLTNVFAHYRAYGMDTWFAYILPESYVHKFIRLTKLIAPGNLPVRETILHIKKHIPIQSRRDLQIDGKYILNIFPNRKKGAWIGRLLQQIELAVVNGELDNNEKSLREWLLCHPPEES